MPNTVLEPVYVAAGVILRGEAVLLTLRHKNAHQGGLWEFPGGKLEPGEQVEQALVRELQEEVGISVLQSEPFVCIEHDYGDKQVVLDFRLVRRFSGDAIAKEGQVMEWCSVSELHHREFPAANVPVVDKLQQLLRSTVF